MTRDPSTSAVEYPIPLADQASRILRENILAGRLQPGEKINEARLSTTLGISRSPIREGLRKLAEEGLVNLHPRRGAFVATFDIPEGLELLELREGLDVTAVRLAAQRATSEDLTAITAALEAATQAHRRVDGTAPPWREDFHVLILASTRNARLLERGREVHAQLHLARFRSGSSTARTRVAYEEHLAILDAIRRHDVKGADDAMRMHLKRATEYITAMWRP